MSKKVKRSSIWIWRAPCAATCAQSAQVESNAFDEGEKQERRRRQLSQRPSVTSYTR